MVAADGSAAQSVENLMMKVWEALLRSFPAAAICLALLYFGSWMIERVSLFPVGVQTLVPYVGSIMMVVGGIGLIPILPYTIYRLYTKKITSA